ncbi:MAG: molecular chaperone TorD family protein [Sulfuricella sp.]|nr:molecular chaperone TorD family protein [Sulfuricella sp.]
MNDMNVAMSFTEVEKAVARSRVYALLAQGFRYPEEQVFTRFADGSYAEMLSEALEVCAGDLLDDFRFNWMPSGVPAICCRELEADYLSAFETNMPKPSVSLYEGSYLQKGSKAALLLELKGFYRNFGLTISEAENDLEDALTAELEFMQFLTAKQTQVEVEGTLHKGPYLRAQGDFLERHLANWLPTLRKAVDAKLEQPFYRALTELTSDFVARDLEEVRCNIERLDC